MPISISEALKSRSIAAGFSAVHIADVSVSQNYADELRGSIAAGFNGDMAWLAETLERRCAPTHLWPEAKSAIIFAMNYGQGLDPFQRLRVRDTGVISTYALNRDYHDLIKGKLKNLATWFARRTGGEVKVFVDTAPLMEKPLAAQAGLGWQGKHTNLVSRELGSWFFLGAMLTTHKLPADQPETNHCGSCRACLDICPTQAFPEPHKIDARRCISYLTIEHKGHIAEEFRKPMGNRIYGCDDCLAICPWNKFAAVAQEIKLQARADLISPSLQDLLALNDTTFRALFSGSPVKRIGRDRFIRNVLIAAGNSGDDTLQSAIGAHLSDPSEMIRAMAVWALKQIMQPVDFIACRAQHLAAEQDIAVKQEWNQQ